MEPTHAEAVEFALQTSTPDPFVAASSDAAGLGACPIQNPCAQRHVLHSKTDLFACKHGTPLIAHCELRVANSDNQRKTVVVRS